MGLLKGQMSFRLFAVEGKAPEDTDALVEQVSQNVFRELMADREEAFGWVHPDNLLDTDLTADKILHQQYLILALRVDKKSVAAPYFKACFDLEVERHKRDANVEKVKIADKKFIREELRRRLITEAEPTRRTFDMCWDIPAGRVWFFASAEGIADVFADHFKQTFGRRLVPFGLEGRLRRALGKDAGRALKRATPAVIA